MLLQIIKTLSIFLLPKCWPKGKHNGLSTFSSSTLLSGSILVVLAPNWMLLLDDGTSILKGGNTGYTTVNPHNFKLIFTQEQLVSSVWATVLLFPSLYVATVVNLNTLHQDILSALSSDSIASKRISTDSWWFTDPNSLLLLDNRIYVLSTSNLCIHVL